MKSKTSVAARPARPSRGGRPPLPPGQAMAALPGFSISEEQREKWKELSRRMDISQSRLMREALEQHLRRTARRATADKPKIAVKRTRLRESSKYTGSGGFAATKEAKRRCIDEAGRLGVTISDYLREALQKRLDKEQQRQERPDHLQEGGEA